MTSVEVTPIQDGENDRMLGFAEVVLDDEFVVHNLRLVRSDSGPIVAMPNERYRGKWQDIAHPITQDCRQRIEEAVFSEYNRLVQGDPLQWERT